MAAALVAGLAACGDDAPVVALCARGDRDVLADAVVTLELRFFDAAGDQLGDAVALDARNTHVDPDLPAGAARVSAIGFDASDAPIARGEAVLASDGSCICFALDAQHRAACEAVTCDVIADRCRFYGGDGAPLGSQTLAFGEAGDVTGVTSDTYIQEDEPGITHDRAVIETGPSPNRVGLVRFDVSALPRSAAIEAARLTLHVCTAADCGSSQTFEVHAALEAWAEDATWLDRIAGTPWLVAGCGTPTSCAAASLGTIVAGAPGTIVEAALLVEPIAAWVADPSTNLGLALIESGSAGTALHIDASEATGVDAVPPRLEITYRLE